MRNEGRTPKPNRYQQIIQAIFDEHYTRGSTGFDFTREEIVSTADKLGIRLPKNLGDIIYTFRYRSELPPRIVEAAPEGKLWSILPAGTGRYRFLAEVPLDLKPNEMLAETKVPDATPGVISMYSLSDEQALLAKLRYNRLVDIFTGVTCYSLQNHLRTNLSDYGQIETDELYVGVDKRGAHYVFPVEAKSRKEKLGGVQVRQDFWLCADRFPDLICRPIGAQFMASALIALFEFERSGDDIRIAAERHYRLVPPKELSAADLEAYRRRAE